MILPVVVGKIFNKKTEAILILTVLLMTLITESALARRGGDDEKRFEYYGIIQARPQSGWQGEWVIGGHIFTTEQQTKFDEDEGVLSIGSCAKVRIRNGRVHEIDSEPMRDCR